MFQTWGADVINMTTVPEVVLAKEAGICYASIAMATDYDCWKEHEEAVGGILFDACTAWVSMCHEGGQWVQTTLSVGTASVNPGLDREPLKDLWVFFSLHFAHSQAPNPWAGFP